MPLFTVILTLLIGGYGLLTTTPGHTPDVWAHTYRISAILNGSSTHHVDSQSFLHHSTENVGGKVDWQSIMFSQKDYDGYDPTRVNLNSINVKDSQGADVPFNNTATNSPVAYLPQLIGFGLGKILSLNTRTAFILAETVTLLSFAIFMGLAVAALPEWHIIVGCLLPLIASRSFAISADPYTLMMATLFTCMLYRSITRRVSTTYSVLLSVTGILLSMGKFVYAPLTILLLFVPWLQSHMEQSTRSEPTRKREAKSHPAEPTAQPSQSKLKRVFTFIPILGTLGSFLWLFYWMHATNWFTTTPMLVSYESMNERKRSLFTIQGITRFLHDLWISISHVQTGFGQHRLIVAAIWLLLAILFVMLLMTTCLRRLATQQTIFWWTGYIISIGIIVLTYLAIWLQYNPSNFNGIDGMQYRYFLPLAPLWILCGLTCLASLVSMLYTDTHQTDKKAKVDECPPKSVIGDTNS